MTFTVLCSYLAGWVITTIGLALIIGKLNDPVRPQSHPIPLTVAAGAAWPLLLLGATQTAAVVFAMKAARRRTGRRRRSASQQVDELNGELLNA